MLAMNRQAFALVTLVALTSIEAAGIRGAAQAPDYPLRPVPFTAVTVSDAFWTRRIEMNRTVTIPFIFKQMEATGRVDNFAIAGKLKTGRFVGERYNDTDVYKAIEAASYSLSIRPDPDLDRYLDGLIKFIAAAQEKDGYLFTPRTIDPQRPIPGIGETRWSNLPVSHELYNAGHLYEAAVAHFQATGKRTLLDVAIRNADLVVSVFGPDRRRGFPGHQEIEMGLVKLYRVTGNTAYLDTARYFLDQRGRDVKLTIYPPASRFAIYNDPVQIQAHKPVLEQDEAVGHAVRATYMYSGMADVAAMAGLDTYVAAIDRLWGNVTGRKLYLTGGVGARTDREAFGPNYELPNRTAYAESCASIGNAFWNHRMFLLHGDSKYIDVLERIVYNAILAGVSLDGNAFFYANPLESDGRTKFNKGSAGRAPWFDVACCPGNLARFIPSFPGYFYAVKDDTLFVNLFVGSTANVEVGGERVRVTQQTHYPWDGAVKLVVEPEKEREFAIHVRIPGWARNIPVAGDLYRYLEPRLDPIGLSVNGTPVQLDFDKGFARIRRSWKSGDIIELSLPMVVRRVVANDAVAEDAGKVALERGPIVFCVEGADNGGRALNLVLPDSAKLTAEIRPGLLKGVVTIRGTAEIVEPPVVTKPGAAGGRAAKGGKPAAPPAKAPAAAAAKPPVTKEFVAIPYYGWANRGDGEMTVWLRRR
jgi:hypothetical protein